MKHFPFYLLLFAALMLAGCSEERNVEKQHDHPHSHKHERAETPEPVTLLNLTDLVELFEMNMAEKVSFCEGRNYKFMGEAMYTFNPARFALSENDPDGFHVKYKHWEAKTDQGTLTMLFDQESTFCFYEFEDFEKVFNEMNNEASELAFPFSETEAGLKFERNHDFLLLNREDKRLITGLYDKSFLKEY